MKCETYSYSFYRKLIENIKQTKDKQCPDNMDANKVWALNLQIPTIWSLWNL